MIMFTWAEIESEAGYTLTLWCEKHTSDKSTLYQVWHNEAENTVTFFYKIDGQSYRESLPYVACPPNYRHESICSEPRPE